ncbi:hypothetical protein TNCV_2200551 [Trichonephila clavipes]|nr:hypothetical protein TNCV_2200551 [Trichonephila clavipes]
MPWPAALDYAVEDPWREQQLDRDGTTDARLGLSQVSLLASTVNSSWCSSNHARTLAAVWHLALSCWKMPSS